MKQTKERRNDGRKWKQDENPHDIMSDVNTPSLAGWLEYWKGLSTGVRVRQRQHQQSWRWWREKRVRGAKKGAWILACAYGARYLRASIVSDIYTATRAPTLRFIAAFYMYFLSHSLAFFFTSKSIFGKIDRLPLPPLSHSFQIRSFYTSI